jgi:hypothetical protein
VSPAWRRETQQGEDHDERSNGHRDDSQNGRKAAEGNKNMLGLDWTRHRQIYQ